MRASCECVRFSTGEDGNLRLTRKRLKLQFYTAIKSAVLFTLGRVYCPVGAKHKARGGAANGDRWERRVGRHHLAKGSANF